MLQSDRERERETNRQSVRQTDRQTDPHNRFRGLVFIDEKMDSRIDKGCERNRLIKKMMDNRMKGQGRGMRNENNS